MGDNTAPRMDGFIDGFFKRAWGIVGTNVCTVVLQFFHNGKFLRQLNSTLITLIPKKLSATCVIDFRPIALCNVLYKIIAKVLANRLQLILPDLVSMSQNAFIRKVYG